MKSINCLSISNLFFSGLTLLIFFTCTANITIAQNLLTVNAGIGYTSVDLYKWSGYSNLYDWGQTMSEPYIQYYFHKIRQMNIGVEAGYQYLFWYEYDYFDGYYHNYYEYEVDCWRILACARIEIGTNLFAEFGMGLYLFDGFTDFGMTGSIGYELKISEQLSIPIKLRTVMVYDEDANLAVFGTSVGLAYRH